MTAGRTHDAPRGRAAADGFNGAAGKETSTHMSTTHTPARARPGNPLVYAIAAISALGGLLFGYDTGIISSALLVIGDDFHLGSGMKEVVTSTILVGAIVGALAAGALADRFGRRRVLFAVAIVFAAGAVAAALAPDVTALIAARFVLGLSVGGASGMVPVYIAELAPARIRGGLMVFFQLMVAVGQLVSYLVGYALAQPGGWRWMFALAAVPSVVLYVGMLFLPESPRWLIKRGRPDDALAVLRRVREPGDDTAAELAEIQQVEASENSGGWRELTRPWVRPALVVGFGIAMFSQITGINAMVYYAPTMLSEAGFGDDASMLAGVGVGIALVVAAAVGTVLVDRIGRRRILLWLLPGSALSMALLGLAFAAPVLSPALWWVVIVGLIAYIAFNGGSIQVVVWLLGPEVFPLSVRGVAMSLASVAVWAFDLLIALTALSTIEAIGRTGLFLLYAAMNVLCWVFVYYLVPETKGRALEDIERALMSPGNFRRNLDG